MSWFKDWFDSIVKFAQENWERPVSVYQFPYKILLNQEAEKSDED